MFINNFHTVTLIKSFIAATFLFLMILLPGCNKPYVRLTDEDDLLPDLYRPLGEMTVFGFGRSGAANELLTYTPQKFTIGFSEDTTYQIVSGKVKNIVEHSRNDK